MEHLSRAMVAVLQRGQLRDSEDGWARPKTLSRYSHRPERDILAIVAWAVRSDGFYFERSWWNGELWITCVASRREQAAIEAAGSPQAASNDDAGNDGADERGDGDDDEHDE